MAEAKRRKTRNSTHEPDAEDEERPLIASSSSTLEEDSSEDVREAPIPENEDKYDSAIRLHACERNRVSQTIESDVPAKALHKVPCRLGIDEAGRGPVCGPMVYGISYAPLGEEASLAKLGFADSKTLTEEQRESLFESLKKTDFIGWAVRILTPADISSGMLGRTKYNLNALSHDTAIELVNGALAKGVNVQEVYVDTVGPPETYQAKLEGLFPQIPKIVVSKKADSLFPIVSAASICAKVARDRVLLYWQFSEQTGKAISRKMGSGYPSDPNTVKWMNANRDLVFGYPGIVRFSWSTCKKQLDDNCVEVEWEDDDEDEDTPKIQQFFKPKGISSKPRHKFFVDRKLEPLSTLSFYK